MGEVFVSADEVGRIRQSSMEIGAGMMEAGR
jgi:hypothetical protein